MLFLMYTLPGNVVIYQGDEIGTMNAKVDKEKVCSSLETRDTLLNFQKDGLDWNLFPYKVHVFFLNFRQLLEQKEFEWLIVSDNLLVFSRGNNDEYLITAVNFGSESEAIDLSDSFQKLVVAMATPNSNYVEYAEVNEKFQLQGGEGLVIYANKKSTLCKNFKPVDRIVKKFKDAVHKIDSFFNL